MQKIAPWLAIGGLVIAAIALFVAMGKADAPAEGKVYSQIDAPKTPAK